MGVIPKQSSPKIADSNKARNSPLLRVNLGNWMMTYWFITAKTCYNLFFFLQEKSRCIDIDYRLRVGSKYKKK